MMCIKKYRLTLDGARSSDNQSAKSAVEIKPDGLQSMANQLQSFRSNESTNTLVMTAVGYWQSGRLGLAYQI